MKATTRIKNCQFCKKIFNCPYRMGIGVWNKKKYCSLDCSRKGRTQKVLLICNYCQKPFPVFKSWSNLRKRCSKKCESLDKKGKHISPSTEIKRGEHISPSTEIKKGKDHFSWKGGIATANQTERQKDMLSAEYKQWRYLVFKRDNYTCQICGKNKSVYLTAHHILPYGKFPEYKTNVDNGIALCKECHIPTLNKEWKFVPKFMNI